MVIHTGYGAFLGLFSLPFTFHRFALIIRVNEVKREGKEIGSRAFCPRFQDGESGSVHSIRSGNEKQSIKSVRKDIVLRLYRERARTYIGVGQHVLTNRLTRSNESAHT